MFDSLVYTVLLLHTFVSECVDAVLLNSLIAILAHISGSIYEQIISLLANNLMQFWFEAPEGF